MKIRKQTLFGLQAATTGFYLPAPFFLLICLFYIFSHQNILSATTLSTQTLKVDGIYENPSVIVKIDETRRDPVFSFEVADGNKIDYFIIDVASATESAAIWTKHISSRTMDATNYVNYSLIKARYEGNKGLDTRATYYWSVSVYEKGASTETTSLVAHSKFFTSSASVVLSGTKADMKIDFNNPLKSGKITKIQISAFDRDRDFKLRIFSISGTLVKEWEKITVLKDAYYTVDWDGKNKDGVFVARGIYIVNLYDESDKLRINRHLAVVR